MLYNSALYDAVLYNIVLNYTIMYGVPDGSIVPIPPSYPPPPGSPIADTAWRELLDPTSGKMYYYHVGTRKTTWTRPADFRESPSVTRHKAAVART